MNTVSRSFFIIAALACFLRPSFAAFEDIGWGARPLSMGSAFTAIADDANGILFNPAGITRIQRPEFAFTSSKLYTGLQSVEIGQNYFGAVLPLSKKVGNIGIAWHSLYAPALYREDTVCEDNGRSLNDITKFKELDISVGFNAKQLSHGYELDKRTFNDPVFSNGTIARAYSGDAGILFALRRYGISAGIASRNITQPDVGLKTFDKVLSENVFGIAYKRPGLRKLKMNSFTVTAEAFERNKIAYGRAGAETLFFNSRFAARAGYQPQAITIGAGYRLDIRKDCSLEIDYAFAYPLEIEETTGSHRFGIVLKFIDPRQPKKAVQKESAPVPVKPLKIEKGLKPQAQPPVDKAPVKPLKAAQKTPPATPLPAIKQEEVNIPDGNESPKIKPKKKSFKEFKEEFKRKHSSEEAEK